MIAAVVPVKRLADAKSRLSSHLSADERAALALELARGVIVSLRASGRIGRMAVVTPEPHLAELLGVESIPDAADLNSSLSRGVEWARQASAHALLILPADLPLISPEDVQAVVDASGISPGITICATRDGGTGALLLRPPDAVPPSFGKDSFERHLELARERGMAARVIDRNGLRSDLDTVEDLDCLRAR